MFQTKKNKADSKETWWSLEKNGQYIVLQQSPVKDDVTEKLYDPERKEHVQRLGPVKLLESARSNLDVLINLLRAI